MRIQCVRRSLAHGGLVQVASLGDSGFRLMRGGHCAFASEVRGVPDFIPNAAHEVSGFLHFSAFPLRVFLRQSCMLLLGAENSTIV